MFDRVVAARREKRGTSRFLFVSTVAHAAGLAALLVWSFWKIEKLAARTVPVTFLQAAAPPPPPPPAAPPPAPSPVVARRVVRNELVQPDPTRDPDPDREPEPDGEPSSGPADADPGASGPGVPGGVPGGSGHGPACGVDGQPSCPPIVVDRPVVVPLTAVEAARIAGESEIPLPPAVKQAVVAEGRRELLAMAKLCLGRDGVPTEVSIRRSTGYPEADARIAAEMRRWRYRPYRVNDTPVSVCTAITFRYQIDP